MKIFFGCFGDSQREALVQYRFINHHRVHAGSAEQSISAKSTALRLQSLFFSALFKALVYFLLVFLNTPTAHQKSAQV